MLNIKYTFFYKHHNCIVSYNNIYILNQLFITDIYELIA